MFKLNKKGQASSTFQLLIAAIVALAILGVLIAVIGNINPGSNDVKTTTNQLLSQQINNPGARQCTSPVRFQRNTTLAVEGITNRTGLDSEQVFFNTEIDPINNFSNSDGKILNYTGSSDRTVSLCIICSNDGKTGLEDILGRYDDISNVDYPSDLPNTGDTVCIIYTKRAS